MTEEQLIKSLARGDPPALETLIDRYTPYVSAVISRILRGRQADVEELTADVFLAAWEQADDLRPGQWRGECVYDKTPLQFPTGYATIKP